MSWNLIFIPKNVVLPISLFDTILFFKTIKHFANFYSKNSLYHLRYLYCWPVQYRLVQDGIRHNGLYHFRWRVRLLLQGILVRFSTRIRVFVFILCRWCFTSSSWNQLKKKVFALLCNNMMPFSCPIHARLVMTTCNMIMFTYDIFISKIMFKYDIFISKKNIIMFTCNINKVAC